MPADERIRVCHVITGLERGGAENMLARLCETLPRAGIDGAVVSLRGGGPLAARIRAAGVPVTELDLTASATPGLGEVAALRRAIAAVAPEVVHGWMYHGNLAALAGSRRTPVLWNVRQSLYDIDNEKRLTRWVIRLSAVLSPLAEAIVYNSYTSAAQHEAIGFRRQLTRIIPNGFDTALLRPSPEARREVRGEIGVPEEAILVGLVARVHPMKDHETFLGAAARVAAARPGVHFLLAGDGATQELFGPRVRDAGVGERVHLLGPRDDIARVTAALDVACSSSAWGEGFPNSLGEALACGVPCVTTDIGDSARLVGGCGIVVPPRDPAAMAGAILELVDDPDARRRLGAQGRERIISRYSIEAVATEYATLYRESRRESRELRAVASG